MNADTDPNGMDSEDEDSKVLIPRKNIRQLEQAANQGKEALTKLAALEREMAFHRAGIDPADSKLKYFVKGYDGETTVEAIKAAAIEAGFVPDPGSAPPPGATNQGVSQAELDAMSRSNSTTAGAQQPNVSQDAMYRQKLQAARSSEEVLAVMREFGVPVPGSQ
jgi:ribosomal protein L12E/L44/L45/RPP1/RPP2